MHPNYFFFVSVDLNESIADAQEPCTNFFIIAESDEEAMSKVKNYLVNFDRTYKRFECRLINDYPNELFPLF